MAGELAASSSFRRRAASRTSSGSFLGVLGGRHVAALGIVLLFLTGSVVLPTHSSAVLAAGSAHTPSTPSAVRPFVRPANSTASANWTNVTGSSGFAPAPRQGMMMAYDPNLSEVILFGGQSAGSTAFGDTWKYTNGTWTNITSTLNRSPPARWRGGLVYDPVMGDLVLFGGRACYCSGGTGASAGFLNDTWLFNSTGWWPLNEPRGPPPSLAEPMVYDSADQYVFDWLTLTQAPYQTQFWSFQNGFWTNLTSTVSGAPDGLVLYGSDDPPAGYDVFFGGNLNGACGSPAGFALTLTYSNGTFTNLTGALPFAPWDAMGSTAMTYDPHEAGVVMYGGYNAGCTLSNGTYLFRNGTWTNLTSSVASVPPGRWDARLAYDAVNGTDFLFSGNHNPVAVPNYFINDTWAFYDRFDANASATPSEGVAPLNVSFTSQPTGGVTPYAYNWTFGDGTAASTAQNVHHVYQNPGRYTAKLRVTDKAGEVAERWLAIAVYQALAGNVTVRPAAGDAALQVNFASNYIGGVPVVGYWWNFGTGASSSSGNASYTYLANGTYPWSFAVRDSVGEVFHKFGNITVYPGLRVAYNATPTRGIAPLNVTFTATPVGGEVPYSYRWVFGDGTPNATTAVVTHTYLQAGNFTANLTVNDSGGQRRSAQFHVLVYAPLVATPSVTPLLGIAPLRVGYFVNLSGGLGPYAYNWTFGAGIPDSGLTSGTVTYATVGNYTINLTASDSLNEVRTFSYHVEVYRPLTGAIVSTRSVGVSPFAAHFAALIGGGSGGLSYLWSFGDGGVATTGPNASHTYTTSGMFSVQLTLTDSAGETVTPGLSVQVVAPLGGRLAGNASAFLLGGSVQWSVVPAGGLAPFEIGWSGLPAGCSGGNVTTVQCVPRTVGNYTVSVTISDALGESIGRNVTLSVTSAPVQPPSGVNPGGSSGTPLWEYIAVAVVLIAVLAVAALLLRRRGARPPPAEEPSTDSPADEAELPPEGS